MIERILELPWIYNILVLFLGQRKMERSVEAMSLSHSLTAISAMTLWLLTGA